MITVRPARERGHNNLGWLDTWHSFSFDTYYDPNHMGFRALRVINDDVVEAQSGFGTHGHRDMEIITYMLEGEVTHKDSSGGGGVLRPGDVQYMNAGTGIQHSEYNRSNERVRLLQIWLLPERRGLTPGYWQKNFSVAERRNQLRLIAARSDDAARNGALAIDQHTRVYASILDQGNQLNYELASGRHAWLQLARGSVTLNGQSLTEGDGAAVSGETELKITAGADGEAEFLLFDLA
jgi:redox-sensitive bicupin YhaK (pirin superfamily)